MILTILIVIGLLITLIASAGLIVRLYGSRHIQKDQTVVAEYEIPYGLEPAELGYLFDRNARNLEFLATLIMLVQKKVLRLRKDVNNQKYIEVLITNKPRQLSDIEITAFGWVQSQDTKKVYWDQLNDGNIAGIGPIGDLREDALKSLIHKGYISTNIRFSWFRINVYSLLALITIAVIGLIIYFSNNISLFSPKVSSFNSLDSSLLLTAGIFSFLVLYPTFITFFQFLAWLYAKASGGPYAATPVLKSRWREIAGYQLFLKTVEFDRIKSNPRIQNKNLPYAVALGLRLNMDELDLS